MSIPLWGDLAKALDMNDKQLVGWIVLGIISSILSSLIMAHVVMKL